MKISTIIMAAIITTGLIALGAIGENPVTDTIGDVIDEVSGTIGGDPPSQTRDDTPGISFEEYQDLALYEKYDYNEAQYLRYDHWRYWASRFPELYEAYLAGYEYGYIPAECGDLSGYFVVDPAHVGAYGWPRWYGYGGTATRGEFYSFFYYQLET